jgi:hypothetical protein
MAAGWDLAQIRAKVRSVTGRPSSDQLTDGQINDYINNYYVYEMPFELKEQIENNYLQFKTIPGIDVYNFPNGYFTDSPGAYADGFPLVFYQDPDIFFQDWPQQYAVDNIATGDGSTTSFSGGLQNPPVIIGSLFITSDDPTGFQQVLSDNGNIITQVIATGSGVTTYTGTLGVFPIEAGTMTVTNGVENFVDNGFGILTGNQGGSGTIVYSTGVFSVTFNTAVATGVAISSTYTVINGLGTLSGDGYGTINYLTGAYTATFNKAPASTAVIYAKYQGYSGNRPQGVLFFQNTFTMRPVPDQAYQILMQGFIQPKLLINDSDVPLQPEWGQLIAYGASLDIFSDSGDLENYDRYFPVFKRQENVSLGRTIQQYTAEQSVPRF